MRRSLCERDLQVCIEHTYFLVPVRNVCISTYRKVCGGKIGVELNASLPNSTNLHLESISSFQGTTVAQYPHVFPPSPILTSKIPSPVRASPFCSRSLVPQLLKRKELLLISSSRSLPSRNRWRAKNAAS